MIHTSKSEIPAGFYNVKCSGCNLSKEEKSYDFIEIRAKNGVLTSQIEKNYCEKCENFTMWFMGKGVENIELEKLLNWSIEKKLIEIKKINKEIIKIEKYCKYFFLTFIYGKKLNHLKKKIKSFEEEIRELSIENKDTEISESIKFYNELKPKPKCIDCGYDKLHNTPKHLCGGKILYKPRMKRINNNFLGLIDDEEFYRLEERKKKIYEYDEYGNITISKGSLI
tara:strand:- start:16 stop:690 length:675 start_codon:yes stop_codon:yes gene_type:complete